MAKADKQDVNKLYLKPILGQKWFSIDLANFKIDGFGRKFMLTNFMQNVLYALFRNA